MRAISVPAACSPSSLGRISTVLSGGLKCSAAMTIKAHDAARIIQQKLGCDAVLITRGDRGMMLLEAGRQPVYVKTAAREVYDVTGAGDTVIATLAGALAAGATMLEAATLANHAAGIVVGKVGTATATASELVATFE